MILMITIKTSLTALDRGRSQLSIGCRKHLPHLLSKHLNIYICIHWNVSEIFLHQNNRNNSIKVSCIVWSNLNRILLSESISTQQRVLIIGLEMLKIELSNDINVIMCKCILYVYRYIVTMYIAMFVLISIYWFDV